jgi:hypothetical protein
MRSPSKEQQIDDHSHAETDGGDPGHLDIESPFWTKWHAPFLGGSQRQL